VLLAEEAAWQWKLTRDSKMRGPLLRSGLPGLESQWP
jgi:hypothetical protein